MCGICGIVQNRSAPVDERQLMRMHAAQQHRGPDDSGFYIKDKVGLASQRLAILDLSPRGHMPMATEDGRYWIVHNGEVYNYRELRKELEARGDRFRSNTDTEVVLAMYRRHGPAMLEKFNGMFAFAIWDAHEQELFIARDRHGVKPLVYAEWNNALLFASEEKALIAAGVPAEFDTSSWYELLFFRYVAGERTPFKHIKRLLPGHYMRWNDGGLTVRRWWSPEPQRITDGITFDAAVEHLQELLEDSIRLRRISDVPVGVLLSGGLDSSAMAAVMARQLRKAKSDGDAGQVSSFTVRFTEPKYDEGFFAGKVAQRWNLQSHELTVDKQAIPQLLEDGTRYLDAPIVHNNDLHLLAISRFAKPLVTVLLSGEGSDEVFGGYVRYRLFRYARMFWLMKMFPLRIPHVLDPTGRLRKSVRLLQYATLEDAKLYSSAEVFPFEVGLATTNEQADFRHDVMMAAQKVYDSPVRQVMYYEQHTYLQSILDRNDRMTMAASIECREPYLDYRIVEWTASLPTSLIVRGGLKKMLLRKAVSDLLPAEVLSHPKWGFATPLRSYFREIPSLRAYVQKLPAMEFIGTAPLSKQTLTQAVKTFLAGDDAMLPLVRQLLMTAVWFEVCIEGKRNIFEPLNPNPEPRTLNPEP
jgi:asparagine synthase (glutamine-hydrolysing)